MLPVSAEFITAVALYGTKEGPFKELLQAVQGMLRKQLGNEFRPYTLDQIHSTLIRLDWLTDSQSGFIVNTRYQEMTGSGAPMAPDQAMDILQSSLKSPHRIRVGGFRSDGQATFGSRGMHPYERMFSLQGQAFVLVGWPVATISSGISEKPLDDLRRNMNDANILHWYHESDTGIDNDFHLVVGHCVDRSPVETGAVVREVREYLAEHPVEIDIGIRQVAIITSDSPTLLPAHFIGRIPDDLAEIMGLFG
jgi:hypothetical protein